MSARTGRPQRPEMMKATELTDDGLLGRMIAGDEEAFTLLYRRRHPSIYRFALHMSGNPTIAEDVTQEVFMTLIRDPKRFDPTRGTLGGFLFGIARNFLRKRWEQDRRLVALDGDANEIGEASSSHNGAGNGASRNGQHAKGNGWLGAGGSDEFATRETIQRVRHAVGTLPENYREIVVLCDLEEMSYEEAAAALGCPVGTVRSRLHRARAILLEKLRDAQTARRVPAVGT
jgi:RNA polymerase sigma-70 factor, ECF subfamily